MKVIKSVQGIDKKMKDSKIVESSPSGLWNLRSDHFNLLFNALVFFLVVLKAIAPIGVVVHELFVLLL